MAGGPHCLYLTSVSCFMKHVFLLLLCLALGLSGTHAQSHRRRATRPKPLKSRSARLKLRPTAPGAPAQRPTYCNPLNLDYGYSASPELLATGRHRTTADPTVVLYKDDYYLFSSNQVGYWWSHNLATWTFVAHSFLRPDQRAAAVLAAPAADAEPADAPLVRTPAKASPASPTPPRYDDLRAPAVCALGDTLLVLGSTPDPHPALWLSTDPKAGQWRQVSSTLPGNLEEPALFLDDDRRLYLYWGSPDKPVLYGQQIDRKGFRALKRPRKLLVPNPKRYGWQRPGDYVDPLAPAPLMGGAWMTRHAGRYYLQYATPGTDFNGYADAVQVGSRPLGPFRPQPHNPFSFKPEGFVRGAGHGSTFQDRWGGWWHAATTVVGTKNNYERRLGLWPAGFDAGGVLYANTAFGDYPRYLPTGLTDYQQNLATGWLLLNYNKPVQVSSTLGSYAPNYAVDERIKTYWSAATANPGEYLQTDLGRVSTVQAIQINYADQDATLAGKPANAYHQYRLSSSLDGKAWQLLADKSRNRTDVPHDYVDLAKPVQARYIKLENVHVPSGKFALSGLRVFGRGPGSPPPAVRNLLVQRRPADKRSAWLKWDPVPGAYAYNVYVSSTFDKLYSCVMVYGANEYYFQGMDKDQAYYFTIEAVNENGVSSQALVREVR